MHPVMLNLTRSVVKIPLGVVFVLDQTWRGGALGILLDASGHGVGCTGARASECGSGTSGQGWCIRSSLDACRGRS